MTLVLNLANGEAAQEHIHRFQPGRDMGQLASLIEVAFHAELRLTGSRMVEDMRQMAHLGPVLQLAQFSSAFFTGFVWLEGDLLVGNVSLTQEREKGLWTLSNVAVLPDYRGQGIASRLVERALDHVRQSGGRRILLQVRDNNARAQAIYLHRGFRRFDTLHEMDLARTNWPVLIGGEAPNLRLVRPGEGRRIREVVQRATGCEETRQRLLPGERFRRGLFWRLGQTLRHAFSGQEDIELLGLDAGDAVGYGLVTAQAFRGPHEMQFHVVPEARGRWERPLVEGMMRLLARRPRFGIRTYISVGHPEGIAALDALGFETLRVLDQMALDL